MGHKTCSGTVRYRDNQIMGILVKIKRAGATFGLCLTLYSGMASAADLPVTSPYGWRVHPISGTWKFHSGVDLGYDYGTDVPAMFDGVVVSAGNYNDGYGNQIMLYHATGDCYTKYAHLSVIYVQEGAYLVQGQVIGAVGSTGNSTGPHLHLEYIVKNHNTNEYEFVDPLILWE